ncbi:hypothetical protein GGF31_007363 [Allomyces arbusculus]|nr:hypothetical protein GGF31_007363 [Allomyces arbusculus]
MIASVKRRHPTITSSAPASPSALSIRSTSSSTTTRAGAGVQHLVYPAPPLPPPAPIVQPNRRRPMLLIMGAEGMGKSTLAVRIASPGRATTTSPIPPPDTATPYLGHPNLHVVGPARTLVADVPLSALAGPCGPDSVLARALRTHRAGVRVVIATTLERDGRVAHVPDIRAALAGLARVLHRAPPVMPRPRSRLALAAASAALDSDGDADDDAPRSLRQRVQAGWMRWLGGPGRGKGHAPAAEPSDDGWEWMLLINRVPAAVLEACRQRSLDGEEFWDVIHAHDLYTPECMVISEDQPGHGTAWADHHAPNIESMVHRVHPVREPVRLGKWVHHAAEATVGTLRRGSSKV